MRLKSHARILYVAMTAAGFVTLGFVGIHLAMMHRDGRDAWFVYAFVSPFVLVGSLLVYSGASVLLLAARLGRWQLDVPDGGGRLGVPLTLPADGEATAVSARTGAGVMWQLDGVVPSGAMSDQAVFDVPVRH